MVSCKKCGKSDRCLQSHHIIPVGIIRQMKYDFLHTKSNTIQLCEDCHLEIHKKLSPEKHWWKKLEDKTLKMKRLEKMDELIVNMLELELKW